jgi:AAA domain
MAPAQVPSWSSPGDHAQLGAVEAGGGMAMLARNLGHAQLTEAVRFRSEWEGAASLAIRAGEIAALGDYDAHGRLHGGSYEEMAEQAARAYLAEYLAGNDVVPTAFEHRECLDLSRRVQGYLLDWGQIRPGSAAALQEGARAYVGDLVVARENDNQLDAGPVHRASDPICAHIGHALRGHIGVGKCTGKACKSGSMSY